jgi:hypothetical protein
MYNVPNKGSLLPNIYVLQINNNNYVQGNLKSLQRIKISIYKEL